MIIRRIKSDNVMTGTTY